MPIPRKRETKGHFRSLLTYDRSWKKDETRLRKNSASHFTKNHARFTPFHVSFHSSARCHEQTSGQALFVPSLLFRRFRGREFLKARIIPQRIEHWIEPEQCGSERHVCCKRAFVRCLQQFL